MNKISAEHLKRAAYVYVRQSTFDQVQHNRESQRRQYALADRARSLGWTEVSVIDDDLGRSGGGSHRPGFRRQAAQAAIQRALLGLVMMNEEKSQSRCDAKWLQAIAGSPQECYGREKRHNRRLTAADRSHRWLPSTPSRIAGCVRSLPLEDACDAPRR
jgi:hypothetical protein